MRRPATAWPISPIARTRHTLTVQARPVDRARLWHPCECVAARSRSDRAHSAGTCAQTLYPAGKLPAEEAAIKGEGKGPEGRDVAW